MKIFEINRKITRGTAAGIFLRFGEVKGILIVCFFLLPLMALPFDLILPWVEMDETGTVRRSFPSEGWFGTYFTHEFTFQDSKGVMNTAFSFSKQPIPLGNAPLEQSTFKDVRIQGTHVQRAKSPPLAKWDRKSVHSPATLRAVHLKKRGIKS